MRWTHDRWDSLPNNIQSNIRNVCLLNEFLYALRSNSFESFFFPSFYCCRCRSSKRAVMCVVCKDIHIHTIIHRITVVFLSAVSPTASAYDLPRCSKCFQRVCAILKHMMHERDKQQYYEQWYGMCACIFVSFYHAVCQNEDEQSEKINKFISSLDVVADAFSKWFGHRFSTKLPSNTF